jgi:hypothetical protein
MQTAEGGPSKTECNEKQLQFHALGKRAVIGKFDGGTISSDVGALLLSEVETKAHTITHISSDILCPATLYPSDVRFRLRSAL